MCAKIVQKKFRMTIINMVGTKCRQKCLNGSKQQDFFTRVITGDESWFFEYDLKPRGRVRNATVSNTEESSHEQIKILVFIFLESRRVVHKIFLPPGATGNQKYFLEVLDHLEKDGDESSNGKCR
jgi:hypothetical protein